MKLDEKLEGNERDAKDFNDFKEDCILQLATGGSDGTVYLWRIKRYQLHNLALNSNIARPADGDHNTIPTSSSSLWIVESKALLVLSVLTNY